MSTSIHQEQKQKYIAEVSGMQNEVRTKSKYYTHITDQITELKKKIANHKDMLTIANKSLSRELEKPLLDKLNKDRGANETRELFYSKIFKMFANLSSMSLNSNELESVNVTIVNMNDNSEFTFSIPIIDAPDVSIGQILCLSASYFRLIDEKINQNSDLTDEFLKGEQETISNFVLEKYSLWSVGRLFKFCNSNSVCSVFKKGELLRIELWTNLKICQKLTDFSHDQYSGLLTSSPFTIPNKNMVYIGCEEDLSENVEIEETSIVEEENRQKSGGSMGTMAFASMIMDDDEHPKTTSNRKPQESVTHNLSVQKAMAIYDYKSRRNQLPKDKDLFKLNVNMTHKTIRSDKLKIPSMIYQSESSETTNNDLPENIIPGGCKLLPTLSTDEQDEIILEWHFLEKVNLRRFLLFLLISVVSMINLYNRFFDSSDDSAHSVYSILSIDQWKSDILNTRDVANYLTNIIGPNFYSNSSISNARKSGIIPIGSIAIKSQLNIIDNFMVDSSEYTSGISDLDWSSRAGNLGRSPTVSPSVYEGGNGFNIPNFVDYVMPTWTGHNYGKGGYYYIYDLNIVEKGTSVDPISVFQSDLSLLFNSSWTGSLANLNYNGTEWEYISNNENVVNLRLINVMLTAYDIYADFFIYIKLSAEYMLSGDVVKTTAKIAPFRSSIRETTSEVSLQYFDLLQIILTVCLIFVMISEWQHKTKYRKSGFNYIISLNDICDFALCILIISKFSIQFSQFNQNSGQLVEKLSENFYSTEKFALYYEDLRRIESFIIFFCFLRLVSFFRYFRVALFYWKVIGRCIYPLGLLVGLWIFTNVLFSIFAVFLWGPYSPEWNHFSVALIKLLLFPTSSIKNALELTEILNGAAGGVRLLWMSAALSLYHLIVYFFIYGAIFAIITEAYFTIRIIRNMYLKERETISLVPSNLTSTIKNTLSKAIHKISK